MIKEAIDRLLQLVHKPEPQQIGPDGDSFVIVPCGNSLLSLAAHVPPRYIVQTPRFMECGSFVDYVNRFKTPETVIFVDAREKLDCVGIDGAIFVAVMDYHGQPAAAKPGRCKHQAIFATHPTPEWLEWQSHDRSPMNQVSFATFLEENAKLFAEPTGAALLELVRSLNGHKNARFSQSVRLDNGAYSASYEEDIQVRGTAGTKSDAIELPGTIKAGIAPFQGAALYEVTARLKTRIQDRQLFLAYETVTPHVIIRDSVLLLTKQVAEKTGIMPWLGQPSCGERK